MLQLGPDVPFLVPASPADAVNLAGDLETLMDCLHHRGRRLARAGAGRRGLIIPIFRASRRDFVQIASEILAGDSGRAPGERPGGAAQRADRGGSAIVSSASGRPRRSSSPAPPAPCRPPRVSSPPSRACRRAPSCCPVSTRTSTRTAGATIGGLGYDATDPTHTPSAGGVAPTRGHHLARPAFRRSSFSAADSCRHGARRASLARPCARPRPPIAGPRSPPTSGCRSAESGCDGLAVIEATDEREEALAIAVALRETLNDPGRTAALVTPDRALAARVSAELARWDIAVEDSAGCALSDTPAGRLARLAADAAAEDLRPLPVLAPSGASARCASDGPRRGGACRVRARNRRVARPGARAKASRACAETLAGNRLRQGRRAPRARKRIYRRRIGIWPTICCGGWSTRSRRFRRRHHGEGALDLIALTEHHRRTVEALALIHRGDEGRGSRSIRRGA